MREDLRDDASVMDTNQANNKRSSPFCRSTHRRPTNIRMMDVDATRVHIHHGHDIRDIVFLEASGDVVVRTIHKSNNLRMSEGSRRKECSI
jgi:hypothetical protein